MTDIDQWVTWAQVKAARYGELISSETVSDQWVEPYPWLEVVEIDCE